MMKITIILFFILTFSISYSQDKPCPTKDETMDWIAGRMKKYLLSPRTFESYSYGLFKYKIKHTDDDGTYRGYSIVTIDLNKLTKLDLDFDDGFVGNKIGKNVYYNENDQYVETLYFNTISMWKTDCDECVFGFSVEDGIWPRIKKAIKCLEESTTKTEGEKF